jgi:nucleoside-diphosphate-sugar epimerase
VRSHARGHAGSLPSVEWVETGNIDASTRWQQTLAAMDVVVHLAARVHVMRENSPDPLAAFREVNTEGTACLARAAAAAGVRRFVYVSTVKVHGENTSVRPFVETDATDPVDPYARSKLEAEQAIQQIAARSGMEWVIVRPPLVYGPGVKGNFLSLVNVVHAGIPLPLSACTAPRSLVGLSNLADLLVSCVLHRQAAGEAFLASDQDDMTTPQLVRRVAAALAVRPRLFPLPPLLRRVARLLRRESVYDRLCEPLQVDSGKATRLLGWRPRVTVEQELASMARWYPDRQEHARTHVGADS